MTGTTGAFTFLILRTTRNRIAKQLARLRTPRYAIAAAVGILYVVLLLSGAGDSPERAPGASPRLGLVGGLGLAITVVLWWLVGGVTRALAFQPAEVQLLFPAPVSRRQLLAYKVMRSQLPLLVNCLIWTLLSRSWGVSLGAPLRFATVWGFFTILSLHRLGAALVLTPPVRGGRRAAAALGKLLAVAVGAGVVAGVAPGLLRLGSAGFAEGMRGLGAALSAPPAAYALAPFRLVTAPLYATSPAAWLGSFAVVVGVVLLHLAWVLSMRVEFEEVAAMASADLARRITALKERRAGGAAVVRKGKPLRTRLPLAPLGPPAVALAWKNTVSLIRTGSVRMIVIVVAMLLVFSQVMASVPDGRRSAAMAIPFFGFAMMTLILGPSAIRNDLRQDLLRLASIKTYPLRGRAVVAGEMASPTLVLTLLEVVMLAIGYFALPASTRAMLAPTDKAVLAIVSPVALLAINAVSVGIQNGAALLFPGWVRLGPESAGFEALGQMMLMSVGSVVVLALSLVLPAGAGVAAYFLGLPLLGSLAGAAAAAAAVLVLAFEVGLLVSMLGGVFERTDPTALG